jgi:glycine/D-amino acid oxidase-like deaminating enzyme
MSHADPNTPANVTQTDEQGEHKITLRAQDARSGNLTYPEMLPMTLSTKDEPLTPPNRNSKHILILGAGVSGLLTAWMLLDKGYRVTIIADDWAWSRDFDKSRMTSQIAGALWEYPPGGCGLTEIEQAGNGWADIYHYREWAEQSFDFYDQYHKNISNSFEKRGHSFGLQMTNLHQFFYKEVTMEGTDDESKKYKALMTLSSHPQYSFRLGVKLYNTRDDIDREPSFSKIKSGFDKQALTSAYTHRAPIINTDKAMAYLMALVTAKGANMETRKFDVEKEGSIRVFGAKLLEDHKAQLIVNATGLGARELAEDKDVYPVRGAVMRVDNTRSGHFRHLNDAFLVPAQKDDLGHPTKTIFIVPRNDDVLYVGSIIQPHNSDKNLTPDSPEVQQMWNRAGDFMPTLHNANMVPMYPFAQGLRPFTKKNAKVRADDVATFPLVHNYGHGGSGWTLGVGTARCAVHIAEKLLDATYTEDVVRIDEVNVTDEARAINDTFYPIIRPLTPYIPSA